jgi:DNA-binding SARP family transcriptional activator
LTILALEVGQAIPAERLIDTLWGAEVPATARTVLQGFVSRLRKTLGGTILETAGNSYRLAVPRSGIDANRFHDLVRVARGLVGDERVASLGEALQLWRGPALSDVAYEPFAQAAIAALEEHRLATREALIEAQLDRRSPEGPGLDTGEDRRTLTKAGTTPTTDTDHRHNADERAFPRVRLLRRGQPSRTPAELLVRS